MFSAAKKQTPYASSASVVDGKLILSLPGAKNPVVWQMDMAEVKASALEVFQDQEQDNTYVLMLRTLKDEFVNIANFTTKEEAVAGLVAVTKALQGAHGMIRPAANSDAPVHHAALASHAHTHKAGKGKWFMLFSVLVVLGVLWMFMQSLRPGMPDMPMDASGGEMRADTQRTGVPVSADDFLNSNR